MQRSTQKIHIAGFAGEFILSIRICPSIQMLLYGFNVSFLGSFMN